MQRAKSEDLSLQQAFDSSQSMFSVVGTRAQARAMKEQNSDLKIIDGESTKTLGRQLSAGPSTSKQDECFEPKFDASDLIE